MAKKSSTLYSTAIGIPNTQSNTFQVNGPSGDSVLRIEPDGYCVITKLALLDDVTGNKWEIKISNGELVVEPIELEDKREHKLNKIFKNV